MQKFIFGQATDQLISLLDDFYHADGVLKGVLSGDLLVDILSGNTLADEVITQLRNRIQLERFEQHLESYTGVELELNSLPEVIHSMVKIGDAKLGTNLNVDTQLDMYDSLGSWLLPGDWSLKEFVTQQKELWREYLTKMPENLETIGAEASSVEVVDSVVGGAFSYVSYQALKKILSLAGSWKRGEISRNQVLQQLQPVIWDAAKHGAVTGFIFEFAVAIFGGWILIPLIILAPFAIVRMTDDLRQTFWQGLDHNQQKELIGLADDIRGEIREFFSTLSLDAGLLDTK
jgi:hypothetical protein